MIGGASIKKIPHLGIWDSLLRNDLPRDFSGREQQTFSVAAQPLIRISS
jgi:hypothetical protein